MVLYRRSLSFSMMLHPRLKTLEEKLEVAYYFRAIANDSDVP
jgi:hypothetical protein